MIFIIVTEVLALAGICWGIMHEDLVIAFERDLWRNTKALVRWYAKRIVRWAK